MLISRYPKGKTKKFAIFSHKVLTKTYKKQVLKFSDVYLKSWVFTTGW